MHTRNVTRQRALFPALVEFRDKRALFPPLVSHRERLPKQILGLLTIQPITSYSPKDIPDELKVLEGGEFEDDVGKGGQRLGKGGREELDGGGRDDEVPRDSGGTVAVGGRGGVADGCGETVSTTRGREEDDGSGDIASGRALE